jgi:hypothetical protein
MTPEDVKSTDEPLKRTSCFQLCWENRSQLQERLELRKRQLQ